MISNMKIVIYQTIMEVNRKMKKKIDKEVGVSYSGFVANQNGELIASARTFKELVNRVNELLGSQSLVIKHVVPEGMIRVY